MLREAEPDESRLAIVARACSEVGRPIIFAIAIIVIVFLPLFTLQGVEENFLPLAQTVALGMFGSLLYALLLAPVMSDLLMRRPRSVASGEGPKEAWIVQWLLRPYRPAVGLFVRHRWLAVGLAGLMLLVGALVLPRLGSEFVPRMDEGDLLIRATMALSISLEESRNYYVAL